MKLDKKALNKTFEKYFEKPLLVMDLLIFFIIIIPFLITLPQNILSIFRFFDITIWILIIAEVSFKLYALDHRLSYLKSNWQDVLVILIPALPNFKVMRLLNLARASAFIKRIFHRLEVVLVGHKESIHFHH